MFIQEIKENTMRVLSEHDARLLKKHGSVAVLSTDTPHAYFIIPSGEAIPVTPVHKTSGLTSYREAPKKTRVVVTETITNTYHIELELDESPDSILQAASNEMTFRRPEPVSSKKRYSYKTLELFTFAHVELKEVFAESLEDAKKAAATDD